jgi:hypothetical protein
MAEIKKIIKKIEADDVQIPEHILHQLLELAMAITGKGEVEDDYTKTIEFTIGNAIIISDPYYGSISININSDVEEINNEDEIRAISEDIKKRLIQFDKEIKDTRKKIASEIFDKPLRRIKNY